MDVHEWNIRFPDKKEEQKHEEEKQNIKVECIIKIFIK